MSVGGSFSMLSDALRLAVELAKLDAEARRGSRSHLESSRGLKLGDC